jgi:S1-C subfamily serine protease
MKILRHIHTRVILFVTVALVAAGVAAGIAVARGKAAPIGTGVVVVNTNLAYENSEAAGTGMVLTASGEVLTNNHVVNGATTIRVVVPGTGHSYAATVVGYDRTEDVAVLRLKGASNLATVSTDTSPLTIGQAVTALGNAGGAGTLTSAPGSVTGLGKSIVASDESGVSERLTGLIETDAGLQPGDSGGPLLDADGDVVGMDTAASAGFGFQSASSTDAYAIPIARALAIARQIESGKASATVHIGATAFLGVEVRAIETTGYGYGSGYGRTATGGSLIAGVVGGGPADRAGLVAGDVITAINGRTVTTPTVITSVLQTKKPGMRVTIRYVDQVGTAHSVAVKLGSGPPQ